MFIGRADVEPETPTLWPPDVKSWLIGKDPDAGKYWRQEKGTTEDKMVGWHHWLDGHGFGWTPGFGGGQGGLVCWGSWGHKEWDTIEQLHFLFLSFFFPLGWTGWTSLQSKGLSSVFSKTTIQKHQFFGVQLSLWSNSHIHTWLLEKT